jgi:pyruvate carboxylase
MKMEMVVQSPRAGTIKTLSIEPGMKLEGEDLILTFE